MRILGRRWLSVFVLFITSCNLSAIEIYVRAGSDGDGSKANPLSCIWKALDKARRGDVILVTEGTYNGKGGSGHFVISIPKLALVGGYKADFSERNPFKYLSIIERAKDFKGDWTGLPESGGFISGKGDHNGLVVDGFVLNGQSRNSYKPAGDIVIDNSYKGVGLSANSPNVRIRNCVVLNTLGDGIYCTWQGKENEISNCFIVNTFYNAIATRSAQPDSQVAIRNCTVAFCWYYPSKGGGMSVFVGRQGKTILENNVFMCNQTEADEAGFGVCNTMGNDATVLKNNTFYLCQGGYYKYMDLNKQNLVVFKPGELADLNKNGEPYMLSGAAGNSDENPQMSPDNDFFEKFSNFVASKPGKLNMDAMNEWRRSVGLPLQAEPGSARRNYGMAYPLSAVIPNLVAKLPGRGVQLEGPFATYAAEAGATAAADPAAAAGAPKANVEYAEVTYDGFKKTAPGIKDLANKPVRFKGGLGGRSTEFHLKQATAADYDCYKVARPGERPDATRDYVFVYILKGSDAAKNWDKLYRKKDKYPDGVLLKGTASFIGKDTYPFPVGVILDDISAE